MTHTASPCPHCQTPLRIPHEDGKRMACTSCGGAFIVEAWEIALNYLPGRPTRWVVRLEAR